MRIALATCFNLPEWEVDDRPLHDAPQARGVRFEQPAWDDGAVDWAAFDGCLIRTTWDYMERCEAYIAWAQRIAAVTALYNPPEIVRWNVHKGYLRDLENAGIPVIDTIWLEAKSTVDVEQLVQQRNWSRAFIKPAIGATARETMRFTSSIDELRTAQQHVDRLLAAGEDLLLQPYCDSVETAGEFSTIWIDGKFSHGVRKIPVPGDYRVQDDFGASDEPWQPTTGELAISRNALDAAQALHAGALDGLPLLYGRVDMLRDDAGGLRITELELVEPSLFFRHDGAAAERLADALLQRVRPCGRA